MRTRFIQRTTGRKVQSVRAISEPLERRQLLSAAILPVAQPAGGGLPASTTSPRGYSPAQIRNAYGLTGVSVNGVTGTGAGQTIAIVAAYDNPRFVDSTDAQFVNSDLHQFDLAMGIADPPSFTKVDENGKSTYPSADSGWANETALDVEWAHAMAPDADILLVEAYSANLSDLIGAAASYALSVPSVSVVNMSFSIPDFSGETTYDSYLQVPAGHQGVTLLAATGDTGSGANYPAVSPLVVAVGSTTLNLSGNSYSSETGAQDSGGGLSEFEPKPSFQSSVTQSSSQRAVPDVSIDGDPATGMSVYDSYNGDSNAPWYKIGGSSAAVVLWTGVIAVADQLAVSQGLATLNGATQTLPELYSIAKSSYHDITSGSNGFNAGTGYDLVTGIGTPIADKLIPALVAADTTTITATQLEFARQPSDVTAGDTISPSIVVDVEKADGSIYTTDHSAVTLSISGADGSLGGTTTVYAVNGVATFGNVSIPTAGTYRMQVTDGALHSAVSSYFVVSPPVVAAPVASKLSFVQEPSTVTAGSVIAPSITVDLLDSSGNLVTTDDSSVTLAIANGSTGEKIGGTVTVHALNGVATFSDVTISAAGTTTLTAVDGSLTAATSSPFTVVRAIPPSTQLAFATEPTDFTATVPFAAPIVVNILDATGAIATTDQSSVTLSIGTGPDGAALAGTMTVNAVNGVATFSGITLSEAGTYTLTATDGSLIAATTGSFAVTPVGTLQPVILLTKLPSAVIAGAKVKASVVVSLTNLSANVSSGLVTTNVYATDSAGSSTLLGTITRNLKLKADQASKITVPISSIPGTLDGAYSVYATVVDTTGNPSSSDSSTAPLVAAAPFVSLAPTVTKTTLPAAVLAGSKSKASVVVKIANTGNIASAGLTTIAIYASTSGTLTGATLIASLTKKIAIKANGSAGIAIPLRLIPDGLDGSYKILTAVTDASGTITTASAAAAVQISPAFTAFNISSAVISSDSVDPGRSTTLSITLQNTGNVPATGLATFAIGLSADGKTVTSELISIDRKVAIAAGKSTVVRLRFLVPIATRAGSYFPHVGFALGDETADAVGVTAFTIT